MTIPAQDDRWSGLYDEIRRVLFEHRLDPTPTNYGLIHHYLTADDASFNGMVDRAAAQGGLTSAAAAALMAERNVSLSAEDLAEMTRQAQDRLAEVEVILLGSCEAQQDYGTALASNAAELAAGAAAAPVVESLIDVTQSMIDKTQVIEEQLRAACDEIRELRASLAEAQDAANRDALTGLPNRRALDARLAAASEAARRTGRPFSIAICDIDHFKAVNDRFGHQIGDEVIKFVAASLSNGRGGTERLFAARYGGEEFVVLFESLDASVASREVDRIRAAIGRRELRVNATGQALGKLTFSAGVAELLAAEQSGASAMLKRADVALYEAKRSGRNRVIVG